MRAFQIISNQKKKNVDCSSQEHLYISSTLLQCTRNMLSSASKLGANDYIFISRFPTIRGGLKNLECEKQVRYFKLLVWFVCHPNELSGSLKRFLYGVFS